VDGIKEKKGENIIVIDLKNNLNAPCDFFVICSAKSKVQINAIANSIENTLLTKLKIKKWQDEGKVIKEELIRKVDHIRKEILIRKDHIRTKKKRLAQSSRFVFWID